MEKIILSNKQALFLIWNAILNQSQDAKKTLNNTFELMNRLNLNDNSIDSLMNLQFYNIVDAISKKPMIHRFYNHMAQYIYSSCVKIKESYMGNPLNVFSCGSEKEIINRLLDFDGIGQHKAEIAVLVYDVFINKNEMSISYIEKIIDKCPAIYNTIDDQLKLLDELN